MLQMALESWLELLRTFRDSASMRFISEGYSCRTKSAAGSRFATLNGPLVLVLTYLDSLIGSLSAQPTGKTDGKENKSGAV